MKDDNQSKGKLDLNMMENELTKASQPGKTFVVVGMGKKLEEHKRNTKKIMSCIFEKDI